jgi:hypothetical protein
MPDFIIFYPPTLPMKKAIVCYLFFLSANYCAVAQTDDYNYHGMFIYNFIKYTEWPIGNLVTNVGVIDNAKATTALEKLGISKKMKVTNLKSPDNLLNYQVIFVPIGSTNTLAKVLEKTKGKPILIVTEQENMVRKGACFSFRVVEGKMKFQINQEAIKNAGLKVASSLSSMAVN